MKRYFALVLFLTAALGTVAWGEQEAGAGHEGVAAEHVEGEVDSHPDLPREPAWVKQVLVVVGIMFVMAIFVGLIIPKAPEEAPAPQVEEEHQGGHGAHGAHGAHGGH